MIRAKEALPSRHRPPVERRPTPAIPTTPHPFRSAPFPGARDAREYEQHSEPRTFTTEPLAEPVEWTGKVKVELYVSSSVKDTDYIVRLSDVYPDGRSILIMDKVQRARFREGWDKEVFMEPGKGLQAGL